MYFLVVFLHILGVVGFLLAHGASMSVAFRLREAQDRESIRTLLDLSRGSLTLMYPSLGLLLLAGITAGFMKNWWSQLWIWTALALLIALMVLMYFFGTLVFGRLRKAAGLPYMDGTKLQPAQAPVGDAELLALVRSYRPWNLTGMGIVGLVLIVGLMIFKPF